MVKNERGLALPTVLILMTALTIIGLTLLGVGLSQSARTVHQEKKEQAFYIAKSGADAIAAYIIDKYNPITISAGITDLNNNYLKNGTSKKDIALPTPGPGTFQAEVTSGANNTVIITSTGKVGNVTDKVVLTLGLDSPVVTSNHAIFAFENINIDTPSDPSSEVILTNGGSVAAIGNITGTITPGSARIEHYTGVTPAIIPFINASSWPKLTLGSKSDWNGYYIDQSGYYGEYNPTDIAQFSIKADSKEFHAVFGKMNTNTTIITIVDKSNKPNDGIIHIYADSIKINGSFIINNFTNRKVILHVKDKIDYYGSFVLEGVLLYAPTAKYTVTSGSLKLRGAMVFKDVTMKGNSTVEYDSTIANLITETLKYHRIHWSDK